jgi:hypothetical protein
VNVRTRRARVTALAACSVLLLGTSTAALADEHEGDDEELEVVEEEEDGGAATGVACDAEPFADEFDDEFDDEFPFYLVAPGEEVDCVAWGLDADTEDPAGWEVAFYGILAGEPFGDDTDEPIEIAFEDDVEVTEDGEIAFSFVVPGDILIGGFDGIVWQGPEESEELTYLEEFGGAIIGDVFGDLACEPDPVRQGEDVDCAGEGFADGGFDWEVYYLTVDDLIDLVSGEGDLDVEPDDAGTGDAEGGTAAYSFTVPAEGEIELYLTIAAQDDVLAFYFGEVEEAAAPAPVDGGGEPTPTPSPTPTAPAEGEPVAVPQPTRVDAGAGGTAHGGLTSSTLFGMLALAGLALTGAVRRTRGARP